MAAAPLHVPPDWEEALARAATCERVLVLGPTDAGKSSFIHALLAVRPDRRLIDLDPGQKMIGPPGSASLGRLLPEPRLERFIFLGSTAVGSFRALAEAASDLAARNGFVVNTSGYVQGPGARLQAITAHAVQPDLIVAIAAAPSLEPLLARAPAVRLACSPHARRKPEGYRRSIRQAAFEAALAGAAELRLAKVAFEPAPPALFEGPVRPLCSLADAAGEDKVMGLLIAADESSATVLSPPPPGPVLSLRLGKMWAEPRNGGWRLLERLAPAWSQS